MPLDLVDLDADARAFMLDELARDEEAGAVYLSGRLTPHGRAVYPGLLRAAIQTGDDGSFAAALAAPGMLAASEVAVRRGRPYSKRVPHDAHLTLAEGEFNRYYLRGLCRVVLGLGGTDVEVYRARPVRSARSASTALLGARIDAAALLADLRTSVGVDTALGLPPGPNSGLSARHLRD